MLQQALCVVWNVASEHASCQIVDLDPLGWRHDERATQLARDAATLSAKLAAARAEADGFPGAGCKVSPGRRAVMRRWSISEAASALAQALRSAAEEATSATARGTPAIGNDGSELPQAEQPPGSA